MLSKDGIRRKAKNAFRNLVGMWEGSDFIIEDYLAEFRIRVNGSLTEERALAAGTFKSEVLSVIDRYVYPGHLCLEVGAKVGGITLGLARCVGVNGKVFAVEPGPTLCDRLKYNLALNELDARVSVHYIGLAEQPGPLLTTVDKFFAQPLPRLDFVRLDVGDVHPVLVGSQETLRTYRPIVLFETDRGVRKVTEDLFLGLGYRLFDVGAQGVLTPVNFPRLGARTLALP